MAKKTYETIERCFRCPNCEVITSPVEHEPWSTFDAYRLDEQAFECVITNNTLINREYAYSTTCVRLECCGEVAENECAFDDENLIEGFRCLECDSMYGDEEEVVECHPAPHRYWYAVIGGIALEERTTEDIVAALKHYAHDIDEDEQDERGVWPNHVHLATHPEKQQGERTDEQQAVLEALDIALGPAHYGAVGEIRVAITFEDLLALANAANETREVVREVAGRRVIIERGISS